METGAEKSLRIIENILNCMVQKNYTVLGSEYSPEEIKECYQWFGEKNGVKAAILAGDVESLSNETERLKNKKNHLEKEIESLENERTALEKKIQELASKELEKKAEFDNLLEEQKREASQQKETLAKHVKDAEEGFEKTKAKINKETKIIESFNDFLKETNKNMRIYYWASIGILLSVCIGLCFFLGNFGEAVEIYRINLEKINTFDGMLANAGSLLMLKMPLALLLIGLITGFYKLMKFMLLIYEHINRDKRNACAIYAIMGNLNAESVMIVSGEEVDLKNKDEVRRLQERIKWDKVSDYICGLQKKRHESIVDEDGERP